jgi:hypothetical protein
MSMSIAMIGALTAPTITNATSATAQTDIL